MRFRTYFAAAALLAVSSASISAQEVKGIDIYRANCAMCHQEQGQGAAGVAPPLKGSYWDKLGAVRSYLPGVLLAGLHGPIQTDEGLFNGVMPTQNRLNDAEIAAVSNYLLQQFNGQAPTTAVSAGEVAKLRAKPIAVSALRAMRKEALAK